MTYREIIADIRQFFSGGTIGANYRLSTRRVLRLVKETRARLIYEDLSKKRPIREQDFQTLCLTMEEVDGNVCGCGPKNPCSVLKSSCPVPRVIDNLIKDISSSDAIGTINFNLVKAGEIKYKLNSRIKSEREAVYVFFLTEGTDTYLYLVNNDFLEQLKINALFEDPEAVIRIGCCDDSEPLCNPLDEELLLNERLVPVLKDLVIKYLAPSMGVQQDIFNNSMDEESTQRSPQE